MMLHTKYQNTRHCRFRQEDLVCFPNLTLKQRTKTRNRYSQVPQLTRDTIWESDKIQENTTHKSQEISPFPAGDYMPMKKYATSRNVTFKPQGYNLNKLAGGLLGSDNTKY